MELHAIKVVKCNNCGEDVIINAGYPINSVDSVVIVVYTVKPVIHGTPGRIKGETRWKMTKIWET